MMMGELDFSIIDVFEGNVSIGEGLSLDNLFAEEPISSLLRPNPCVELSINQLMENLGQNGKIGIKDCACQYNEEWTPCKFIGTNRITRETSAKKRFDL